MWRTLAEHKNAHPAEAVLIEQADRLLRIVLATIDHTEWCVNLNILHEYLSTVEVEHQLAHPCKAAHPVLYLAMIVLVGLATQESSSAIAQPPIVTILAGLQIDSAIPFRHIPLLLIKPIAGRLHAASCFLVESWLLTQGTQAGLTDLEDANLHAQRSYVEALRQAVASDGHAQDQRRGWKWDDVISAWVEERETPVRSHRMVIPARARIQDGEWSTDLRDRFEKARDRRLATHLQTATTEPSPDRLALLPVHAQRPDTNRSTSPLVQRVFATKRSRPSRQLTATEVTSSRRMDPAILDELVFTPRPSRMRTALPSVAQSPDLLSLTPLPFKRALDTGGHKPSASPLRRLVDRSKRICRPSPLCTNNHAAHHVPAPPLGPHPESDDPLADMHTDRSPRPAMRPARVVQRESSRLRPFDSLLSEHHGSRHESSRPYR